MNEHNLSDLETRLRQDAERILETQNHAAPVAELLQRHSGRQRRRIRIRLAGVMLLLAVVLPAAWLASGLHRPPPSETGPLGMTQQSAIGDRAVVETPPIVPEFAEPNGIIDPDALHAIAGARPIIFVRINADGEQVSIPGWYIPPRSKSIDFSLLSPAQQRAVREVLGLKQGTETRKPI